MAWVAWLKKPKATEQEVKPPKVIAKAVKQLKVTEEAALLKNK